MEEGAAAAEMEEMEEEQHHRGQHSLGEDEERPPLTESLRDLKENKIQLS